MGEANGRAPLDAPPMGAAIGNILPLAIGVAISPLPVVAIVLMLATPRGKSNGIAFAAGWVLGLGVVCAIVLLVASGSASSDSGPADWVSVVKLVLGTGAVLAGVEQWRSRPNAGEEAELPAWMATIDKFTTAKSLGFGVLLSAANPKNLGLTITAGTTIAQFDLSAGSETIAAAVFVILASVTIVGPVLAYMVLGTRAQYALADLKDTLALHNATIMAIVFVVLGSKLIGDGIAGLSS
jgi:threonine/homoserine/homoserine lactone efflux protein